jgi:hypothetical protein
MLNIVLPIAGGDTRFATVGYKNRIRNLKP